LRRRFLPNRVLASRAHDEAPSSPHLADLFAGKPLSPPAPNLYVCEHFTCQAPAKGRETVVKAIEAL
jgi:uncharacterized protein YyaL (SSP411 family)